MDENINIPLTWGVAAVSADLVFPIDTITGPDSGGLTFSALQVELEEFRLIVGELQDKIGMCVSKHLA